MSQEHQVLYDVYKVKDVSEREGELTPELQFDYVRYQLFVCHHWLMSYSP